MLSVQTTGRRRARATANEKSGLEHRPTHGRRQFPKEEPNKPKHRAAGVTTSTIHIRTAQQPANKSGRGEGERRRHSSPAASTFPELKDASGRPVETEFR